MWYHSTVHRLFHDDPVSASISRLRASGVVIRDAKSAIIVFGEGNDGLSREVKVVHRRFSERRRMVIFHLPSLRPFGARSETSQEADVPALLSSPGGWVSHIERLAGQARRRAGGAAPEVARAPRWRAGEIASEGGPQAGPQMVAYGFVAEGNDPRAPGSAATAPRGAGGFNEAASAACASR